MMDKLQRSAEIAKRITSFCEKYLTNEFLLYALELAEILRRKRKIDITRGKPEIWAASIVYVIARLNFLFDKESPDSITPDTICDFFETKKSTTSNKATDIEKACNIKIGDPHLGKPEITDMLTYYQTPDGLMIPKNTFKNNELVVELMDEEESKQFEKMLQEKQRQEQERISAAAARKFALRKERDAQKRKLKFKNQIDLFGDE